jgi:hypothetical protein
LNIAVQNAIVALQIALRLGLPFLLGWMIASRNLSRGRALGAFGLLVLLLTALIVAGTGVLHHVPDLGEVHRWLAHAMVIVAWCLAPYCAAVFICMWRVHRFTFALACEGLLLLLSIALVLHTSFTGYLYVEPVDAASEATYNRFVVIHQVVEPLWLFVFLAGWLGAIWPRGEQKSPQ